MSDKSSEGGDMSSEAAVLDWMHRIVREAAEPVRPGDSIKACIGAAARRLGLSYARARAHWYREARSVPAAEWIATQEARLRLRRERVERLRAELAALEGNDGPTAPARLERVHLDRGPLA